MAMSYVMDLSGAHQMRGRRLGAPMSFLDYLKKLLTPLPPVRQPGQALSPGMHGPWQLLNERQGERMNTIIPAGSAYDYATGAGIPYQSGWTMRPGANLPVMPTPRPLQGSQLGGITDVIMSNPVALILGVGVGIYIASRKK
jgi:hypothetical protein